VNNSAGTSCRKLNGMLATLSARCVISIESNILQSSCSTPQFFSEENSKCPPAKEKIISTSQRMFVFKEQTDY